jgi:alpha-L-rhamnosidase
MRGNYLDIPTDCPQRDERLGWTGDAQVFIRAGAFNYDIAGFHRKWIRDMVDAQRETGAFTDIVPFVDVGVGAGRAAWADAGIIVPWEVYRHTGDKRFLSGHYDSFIRFIDYMKKESKGYIRPAEGYGDWLSINAETPKDLIGTAYFARSTRLLARIAEILGKTADAANYHSLADDITDAFRREYVTPSGRIIGETQTAYLLALGFDLAPVNLRVAMTNRLTNDIEKRGWKLSTGFVGCPLLLPVLEKVGRADIAFKLLLSDEFPSWGFMIKHGATTMWERWDGWTPDKGFQDVGMNSFNHYAFGAVGEFLYYAIAGLRLDEAAPGLKHIAIRPIPGGELTRARAEYASRLGTFVSDWTIEDKTFKLQVVIPPSASATVELPGTDARCVSGSVESSAMKRTDGGGFEIGAGEYRFESKV